MWRHNGNNTSIILEKLNLDSTPIEPFEKWLEKYYDIAERTEGMIAMEEAGVPIDEIRTFFKRVRAVELQTLL